MTTDLVLQATTEDEDEKEELEKADLGDADALASDGWEKSSLGDGGYILETV